MYGLVSFILFNVLLVNIHQWPGSEVVEVFWGTHWDPHFTCGGGAWTLKATADKWKFLKDWLVFKAPVLLWKVKAQPKTDVFGKAALSSDSTSRRGKMLRHHPRQKHQGASGCVAQPSGAAFGYCRVAGGRVAEAPLGHPQWCHCCQRQRRAEGFTILAY